MANLTIWSHQYLRSAALLGSMLSWIRFPLWLTFSTLLGWCCHGFRLRRLWPFIYTALLGSTAATFEGFLTLVHVHLIRGKWRNMLMDTTTFHIWSFILIKDHCNQNRTKFGCFCGCWLFLFCVWTVWLQTCQRWYLMGVGLAHDCRAYGGVNIVGISFACCEAFFPR